MSKPRSYLRFAARRDLLLELLQKAGFTEEEARRELRAFIGQVERRYLKWLSSK